MKKIFCLEFVIKIALPKLFMNVISSVSCRKSKNELFLPFDNSDQIYDSRSLLDRKAL